jgi:drug/metabolite transporter (DMT)-like permease
MMHVLRRLPPEALPLVVNVVMLGVYILRREPGKIMYWIGACLLTVGLMIMKG